MTLFGTLARQRSDYPEGNPARLERRTSSTDRLWDTATKAGVSITDENALTLTAVYAANVMIASTIGQLPLHVYAEGAEGRKLRSSLAEDRYLWERPNPEVPRAVFWETVVGHEVGYGNAYLFVQQNRFDQPLALWPIEPWRVRVGRDRQGAKLYEVDAGAVVFRDFVAGGDIVHVANFGRDGLTGINPIRQAAQSLGIGAAAEEWVARFFGQGALPAGTLETDQELTSDEALALGDAFDRSNGGLRRAHKPAVLTSGLKWHQTSADPDKAQLQNTRTFQVAEVARLFQMPEHLLGSHDKQSSWGTGVEVLTKGFHVYTLQRHLIRWEQTLDDELLRDTGRYVKFEIGGLLRPTHLDRAKYYQTMILSGVMTPNEARELEDFEPLDGGDDLWRPMNIVPIDTPPPAQRE